MKPSATTPPKSVAPLVSDPISSLADVPARVVAIRKKILEACAKGDVEALRIPIDWNEVRPLFERGAKRPPGTDPIAIIKSLSYGGAGLEYVALLRNVLRQSCVRVRIGAQENYVWPAFAFHPPKEPTPEERVAMLSCVRFADLGNTGPNGMPRPMRAGFGADGTWHYFWSYG